MGMVIHKQPLFFFCLENHIKSSWLLYNVVQSSYVFLESPKFIVSRVLLRLYELRLFNALQIYPVF